MRVKIVSGITWKIEFWLVRFCGIHPRAIAQLEFQSLPIDLKMICFILLPHLPGVNESWPVTVGIMDWGLVQYGTSVRSVFGRSECDSKMYFSILFYWLVYSDLRMITPTPTSTPRWMTQDPTGDKSTLVQVMAWCRQATGHYLNQCSPNSLSPYGVARTQWKKLNSREIFFIHNIFVSCPIISLSLAIQWVIDNLWANNISRDLA